MKPGDRVLIRDKKHKWYGNTGTLTAETMQLYPDMYRVELDNGFAAGCYLTQLEKL